MEQRPRPCGRAGFVLAGGRSTRMGREKALLPHGGGTLIEHIAMQVEAVTGRVVILGDPAAYNGFGYPVVADLTPGCGPLGGIETALRISDADWNLVVACDMPNLTQEFLAAVLDAAEASGGDCLVPVSPSGQIEPLCAAYHRDCLPRIEQALASGVRAVHVAIAGPRVVFWPVVDDTVFRNLNTPEDLARFEAERSSSPV